MEGLGTRALLSPPHPGLNQSSRIHPCKIVGLVVGEAEEVRGLSAADNETRPLCTSARVHPLRLWALLSEPLALSSQGFMVNRG